MEPNDAGSDLFAGSPPPLPRGWLGRNPGVAYVLPFVVYMIVGTLEPSAPKLTQDANAAAQGAAGESDADQQQKDAEDENAAARLLREQREEKEKHDAQSKIPYEYYPVVYSIKIGLTVLTMLMVLPGYLAFPLRVNGIAVAVGLGGAALWIGLCKLHLEAKLLEPLGLGALLDMGRRPGFNPLKELASDPTWAYGFLAIRFFGLCVVVPIIEEFFLRVFLMRYVMHIDWHLIPFGKVDRLALIVGTAVPMLMHPAELFAAAAWFSLVTWLMLRTRNIWDCVVAHALTNLSIGLWVLWSGDWFLM